MNQEFDDSLKSRITDIFDNYEDDSAHEGWLLLREKYPEEKKRRALWLWWASAAAVLFVVLGLGLWLNTSTNTLKNNAIVKHNTPATKQDDNPVAIQTPVSNDAHSVKQSTPAVGSTISGSESNIARQNALAQSQPSAKANLHKAKANYLSKTVTARQFTTHHKTVLADGERNSSTNQPNVKPQTAESALAFTETAKNVTTPPTKQADTSAIATNTGITLIAKSDSAGKSKSIIKENKKTLFASQPDNEVRIKKQTDKAVKFGVYAATYVNYAKGSDNEFNFGAGFSSEIKLIGNLKLLTGLAIAQNSLQYTTTIPQAANGYFATSLAQNRGTALAADVTASNSFAIAGSFISPTLQTYQASLIGLDIPVNLKYQFTKNDTYIAAGVSSGTYINESYQFQYGYNSTSSQNTKTQTAFNTFDFARTLNVSFGMGYPLGKNNRLVIEPFVKYPLGGLGAQQIKFGAGGVNLKLNFSPIKK